MPPTNTPEADVAGLVHEWHELSLKADEGTGDDATDAFNIGMRDGYSQAVQTLDVLTGGDGEYRYCTVPDDRHCPEPPDMIRRIVDRLSALPPAGEREKRLEGALKQIADGRWTSDARGYELALEAIGEIRAMRRRARAALDGEE